MVSKPRDSTGLGLGFVETRWRLLVLDVVGCTLGGLDDSRFRLFYVSAVEGNALCCRGFSVPEKNISCSWSLREVPWFVYGLSMRLQLFDQQVDHFQGCRFSSAECGSRWRERRVYRPVHHFCLVRLRPCSGLWQFLFLAWHSLSDRLYVVLVLALSRILSIMYRGAYSCVQMIFILSRMSALRNWVAVFDEWKESCNIESLGLCNPT